MRGVLSVVTLGMCSLLLGGCGGDGIPRVAVEGSVSFEGSPVTEGSITFIPVAAGPAAGTTIENGRYLIAEDKGPSPGEYRVEIRSPRLTGKQALGTDGVTMEPVIEEGIPAKYNSKTELKSTLASGQKNQVDFDLKK